MREFKNENELYKYLLPALRAAINEYKINGINNLTELDIWNYLKNNVWTKANDLTVFEMVNDIFDINETMIMRSDNDVR